MNKTRRKTKYMYTSGTMGKQEAQSPKTAKKEHPDCNDPFPPRLLGERGSRDQRNQSLTGSRIENGKLILKIHIHAWKLLTRHKALAACKQAASFLFPKAEHWAYRKQGFIWTHVKPYHKDSGFILVFSSPKWILKSHIIRHGKRL